MGLRLLIAVSIIYLAFVHGYAVTLRFKLIAANYQFAHGNIMKVAETPEDECAVQCASVGCRSWSVNSANECWLNYFHFRGNVDDNNLLIKAEDGVRMFSH